MLSSCRLSLLLSRPAVVSAAQLCAQQLAETTAGLRKDHGGLGLGECRPTVAVVDDAVEELTADEECGRQPDVAVVLVHAEQIRAEWAVQRAQQLALLPRQGRVGLGHSLQRVGFAGAVVHGGVDRAVGARTDRLAEIV